MGQRFPADSQPAGTRFPMVSGKVGLVAYSNCLTVHTSEDGLYLSILFPFRLGHPPVFIPWEAIYNPTRHRFLWMEAVEVGSPAVTRLRLPAKVFAGHVVAE